MSSGNRKQFQVILAAALASAIGQHLPVMSCAADLSDQIVTALDAKATAVSHLTVSWQQTRTSRLALDELLELIHRPTHRAFLHARYETVIYQGGRLWSNSKYTQWVEGKFVEVSGYRAFDGKLFFSGNNSDFAPSVAIRDLDYLSSHNPDHYVYHAPYLTAAGFKVHNRFGTIDLAPESLLLHLVDNGGQVVATREEALDSIRCLVVEVDMPTGREVFYLDPAIQYATRKRETFDDAQNRLQATLNTKFEKLASPPVWLPRACQIRDYTWRTVPEKIAVEPILVTCLAVTNLNQKVWPAERFVMDHSQPGSFVQDSRPEAAAIPGAVLDDAGLYNYRIDATPDDLARTVKVARSRRRIVWIGASSLAILLLVLLLAVRKKNVEK
jgi:hypothetical protein